MDVLGLRRQLTEFRETIGELENQISALGVFADDLEDRIDQLEYDCCECEDDDGDVVGVPYEVLAEQENMMALIVKRYGAYRTDIRDYWLQSARNT